jgi:hypothetical protein
VGIAEEPPRQMLSKKYEYKARECAQIFSDLLTFIIAQPTLSL